MRLRSTLLIACIVAISLLRVDAADTDATTPTSPTDPAGTTKPTEPTQPTQPTTEPTTTPTTLPTTAPTTAPTDPGTTPVVPTTTTSTNPQVPPTDTNTTPAPVTEPTPPPTPPTDSKDSNGIIITQTATITDSSALSTTSSAAPTKTGQSSNSSTTLGTGSIVGMSVAGGVALIGIIAFFVWKFTRKRFGDFDDNEAIKWPDLNTHGEDVHAMPVNNTGRSGFGDSETSLSRGTSEVYPSDFNGADPYFVPPLPHLNPNQPYRDDPNSAYYDPYRGPQPPTFDENSIDSHERPTGDWQQDGQTYPMSQLNQPQQPFVETGRMSPSGRSSPQIPLGYGNTRPESPFTDRQGRSSPGPQAAYGVRQ